MGQTKMPSVGVKDVDQQKFTAAMASFLKKSGKVKLPEWVDIVKTNVAKEMCPFDEDWYYTRLASLARHIYIRSPVGVSTVCKIYGVRRNNGSAPSHWQLVQVPSPGRLFKPLNNSKWSKKIPMEAEDCPHKAAEIWTVLLPKWLLYLKLPNKSLKYTNEKLKPPLARDS